MKQVQDVVERLWDFIDKLDINTFRKFLADNIVGSVVAFSLLFWVPFSILVHCVVGITPHIHLMLSMVLLYENCDVCLSVLRDDPLLCTFRTRRWIDSMNRPPSLCSSL
ncbi:hypothetical protein ILYODFUR_037680, partial [Ilyodon furcidens]